VVNHQRRHPSLLLSFSLNVVSKVLQVVQQFGK
jgi:hypothetical protein